VGRGAGGGKRMTAALPSKCAFVNERGRVDVIHRSIEVGYIE